MAVRAGEILGIAGVQGNGQTELVEALAGLRHAAAGRILVLGRDVTQRTARAMVAAGTAYIPEDRQRDGLVLTYSVRDNLILRAYYTAPFARGVVLDWGAIDEHATALVAQYDIRAPGILAPAGSLSGGNQQKIVVAGELSRPIKLLVAAHPTRGLDIGSTAFIHRRLLALRDDGAAIVLVSAELDELIACADRIAVMYRGRIVAMVPAGEATREQLGLWMAGVTDETMIAPAARGSGFRED
jgi:simple sugar transport system ATP-binding protein